MNLFTLEQIFYIHDFSFNYDILPGRKLLEANQAKIDSLNNRTTISGSFFLHKNISLKNLTQLYDFEAFIKNGMGILFHLKKKLSIKYRIC